MSVDVIIRQKGLFRKPLALQPVTGGELRYGKYNSGWRLEEDEKLDLTDFTCYLPEAIGRGISVTWDPRQKREVSLRLLTPTGTEEIRAFGNIGVTTTQAMIREQRAIIMNMYQYIIGAFKERFCILLW